VTLFPEHILLLDIDGVLLQPAGYRRAVAETLRAIFPQPELSSLILMDSEQSIFEAFGITSEWDMIAISTVAIMNQIHLNRYGNETIPDNLFAWKNLPINHPITSPDYHEIFSNCTYLFTEENPSAGFFQDIKKTPAIRKLFDWNLRQHPILELLSFTRNFEQSQLNQIFQAKCLGDRYFLQTYGIKLEEDQVSYLESDDKPLLSADHRMRLQKFQKAGLLGIAAITSRPSLPPRGITQTNGIYPPEAELALEVIGWPELPLIGLGRLEYVAHAQNIPLTNLLKPQPFHSVASIYAAAGYDEQTALTLAVNLTCLKDISELNIPGKQINITVIEDSTNGLKSVNEAVKLFQVFGFDIKLLMLGIATNSPKKKALLDYGAKVYPDVASALNNEVLGLYSDD
jgi:hypothetical protein